MILWLGSVAKPISVSSDTAEGVCICDDFSFRKISVFYYSSMKAKIGIILNKAIL